MFRRVDLNLHQRHALISSNPRRSTVKVMEQSLVYCLARTQFLRNVRTIEEALRNQILSTLNKVECLSHLPEETLHRLIDVMPFRDYEKDEVIIGQDEKLDRIFILTRGKALAYMKKCNIQLC